MCLPGLDFTFPATTLGGEKCTHTYMHVYLQSGAVSSFYCGWMWFSPHWRTLCHPLHLPLHPKLQFPFTPSSLPHLTTHHCPAKRWQLVTNGLRCTQHVSCPGRWWQTWGREGEESRRGRARRDLAEARRREQVAENQYRSGLWLGLIAQDQRYVGILWVPHTAEVSVSEQRKSREGSAETCFLTLLQRHFDRMTRTHSTHMHTRFKINEKHT